MKKYLITTLLSTLLCAMSFGADLQPMLGAPGNTIEPLSIISPGNPSYASTDFQVGTRATYYVGYLPTAAPYGSTVSGVTVSIRFGNVNTALLNDMVVFICMHQQTQCRGITDLNYGLNEVTTSIWDGLHTWQGSRSLSSGWELYVGVIDYGNGSRVISPAITVDASVSMGHKGEL